jgi:DNA-binding transcriptional ArsR family regulator
MIQTERGETHLATAGKDKFAGKPMETKADPCPGVNHAAELFSLLGNSARLTVLDAIRDRAKSVGELTEISGLSQSALSQHLAKLKAAGVVSTERKSQEIHYRLADPTIEALLAVMALAYGAGRSVAE